MGTQYESRAVPSTIDLVILHFETHATSLDNEAGLASGWHDVALSARGEEQARALGLRYQDVPLAAVYTSDLERARRTAELAFGSARRQKRDPRLRECDYGALTRRPSMEIDAERLARIDEPFPGGESYREATVRLSSWLDEAVLRHPQAQVLLIGHRATWYALEHLLNRRPLAEVIAAPWRWQPGWQYQVELK